MSNARKISNLAAYPTFAAAVLDAKNALRFTSSEKSITLGGTVTIAHGLGAAPWGYDVFAVCKTAEAGFSVGQKIKVAGPDSNGNANGCGVQAVADDTNVVLRIGATAFAQPLNFATGVGVSAGLTPANWRLIVRAEL